MQSRSHDCTIRAEINRTALFCCGSCAYCLCDVPTGVIVVFGAHRFVGNHFFFAGGQLFVSDINSRSDSIQLHRQKGTSRKIKRFRLLILATAFSPCTSIVSEQDGKKPIAPIDAERHKVTFHVEQVANGNMNGRKLRWPRTFSVIYHLRFESTRSESSGEKNQANKLKFVNWIYNSLSKSLKHFFGLPLSHDGKFIRNAAYRVGGTHTHTKRTWNEMENEQRCS